MDTLTVTLRSGKLSFSRAVFAGSTYALAFAGEAAGQDGLTLTVLHGCGRVALAQSVTAEGGAATLALTWPALLREFRGHPGEAVCLTGWLTHGTGTAGFGPLSVRWSPLAVDVETGTAATLKGDPGVGVASVARDGASCVFTLTDGSTRSVDISDMKGDKGDTGSALSPQAAALVAALPPYDPQTAKQGELYDVLGSVLEILRAMNV